ncbi:22220_t:CDS:10 [Entrophospora sp. SA101]|nr:22220_t:CDS:10 [Entrophospora sp. SA101]
MRNIEPFYREVINRQQSSVNSSQLLQREIENLKQQLQEHQNCAAEKQQFQNQINSLNNTNSQQNQQINTLNSEKTTLTNQVSQLQQEKQSLSTQLEQAKKDKTTAEQERDKLKAEHANCQKEKEQLAQQIKDKDQELTKLNQQLQDHQTCQTEIAKLNQQITQLQQEKQDLQQQFDEIIAELTDTTGIHFSNTNYSSTPLTIKKIEKKKTAEGRDGYLVEVEETITYRRRTSQETFTSQEIRTFKHTYEDGNNIVNGISKDKDGASYDAFYYFAHYLGKKVDKGIPFRKYWFSNNLNDRIFCLSDVSDFSNQENKDINDIIKKEKENEKEKESIKNASTIAEVEKIQKEISSSREGQNNLEKDRQDALDKDPNTNTKWNPDLTEDEKEVIKDPSLDSSGAIQTATNLLSHLRSIRNDKENGEKKLLEENSTPEAVVTAGDKLIKNINDRKKIEEDKQKEHEKEIQTKIDEAQRFARDVHLTEEESNDLLKELRKDKKELGDKALSKVVENLETRIRGEEAIRLVKGVLDKAPRLQASDLGNEYRDYANKFRQMKTKEEINKKENEAFELAASIRPIRAHFNELLKSADEILDPNNNSREVQEKRQKVLNLIFDLEKFRDIRDQALARLNKSKELLENLRITVNASEFANYQQSISRASSQELQLQKYENEFSIKQMERGHQVKRFRRKDQKKIENQSTPPVNLKVIELLQEKVDELENRVKNLKPGDDKILINEEFKAELEMKSNLVLDKIKPAPSGAVLNEAFKTIGADSKAKPADKKDVYNDFKTDDPQEKRICLGTGTGKSTFFLRCLAHRGKSTEELKEDSSLPRGATLVVPKLEAREPTEENKKKIEDAKRVTVCLICTKKHVGYETTHNSPIVFDEAHSQSPPAYQALLTGLMGDRIKGIEKYHKEIRPFKIVEMSATFTDLPTSKKLAGMMTDYYLTDFTKINTQKHPSIFKRKVIAFCDAPNDKIKLDLLKKNTKVLVLSEALKPYATDIVRSLEPPLFVVASNDFSVGFSFGDVDVLSTGEVMITLVVEETVGGEKKLVEKRVPVPCNIADLLQQRGRGARDSTMVAVEDKENVPIDPSEGHRYLNLILIKDLKSKMNSKLWTVAQEEKDKT